MNAKKVSILAAALFAGTVFLAAPAAHAATNTVIAQEQVTSAVIAQDQSAQLQAIPTAPRAITVTTEPGASVTLTAAGTKHLTRTADVQGKAVFNKLTAGTHYTVTSNGKTTAATPVVRVGRASDLTVRTTDRVGTVDLTWQHKATRAQGAVGFTVTATPAAATQTQVTIEVATTQTELTSLDPNTLYSFTVTPHNALGAGKPSIARMSRSLADVTGRNAPVAQETASEGAKDTTPRPHPQPQPSPAPAPAPVPAPAPAPQPSTRTIWVCPDGWNDVNGVCTQTRAYTYSTVQQTQPYTYRTEQRYESCTGGDCPGSEYRDFGTDWSGTTCPYGGTMHGGRCLGWTEGHKWVSYQVKDAPPMGWYDDGTQFAKDVQVKDATPTGWSDNGTEWIRTTAKVEKVVPA